MTTKLMEAQTKSRELSLQALAIAENREGKYATAAEQKTALDLIEPDIKKWLDEVQDLESVEAARKRYAAAGDPIEKAGDDKGKDQIGKLSFGQQFVKSGAYAEMLKKGFNGNWQSEEVELKALLAEGTSGTPGDGYAPATIIPNTLPGIVDIKFRPLTISQLFPGGGTESPVIQYLVETIATNGAAGTPEGGLAPESRLKFEKALETLADITTFLPVTNDMLSDYQQIQSYIDARLELFVSLEEERQLLEGAGSDSDEILGLLNREGLATAIAKGTSPSASDDTAMDAIYRQITAIRVTQFLEPDAFAIDPIGWEKIVLSKNSVGTYYAGGPFVSEADRTLWGKKGAVSTLMTTSEALVGAFAQGGQIFTKGGIVVTASNSHADYFQRGLTAIRAQKRSALAVYRPGAFGLVTNL